MPFKATRPPVIPSFGYRYLFFFGDFLNEEELGDFGILPRPVSVAINPSRRWITNSEGRATMVGQSGFEVHGMIHAVPEPEVTALDLHFGVPREWERYGGLLRAMDGRLMAAEYYASSCQKPGVADPIYVDRIARRGEALGFPNRYVAELRAWTVTPIPHVALFSDQIHSER